MRAILLSVGAALLASAVPAFAQDTTSPAQAPITPDVDTGGNSITVGVGAALVPTYEGSDNSRVVPVPAIRGNIDGYAFSTRGSKLVVDIVPNDEGPVWDYQFGPVVSLNFNRVGDPGDARVDALGRKKIALEVGGMVGIGKTGVITSDYDKLSVSAVFVNDVTGIHNSFTLTPQIDYGTPLSRRAYVGLSASATYVGNGYANTYFGISPSQVAASGLPAFNPESGFKNWSLSALGAYSLTGDLLGGVQLIGGVSYSRLLSDFANSPITRIAGDRNQWFYALGIAYTF